MYAAVILSVLEALRWDFVGAASNRRKAPADCMLTRPCWCRVAGAVLPIYRFDDENLNLESYWHLTTSGLEVWISQFKFGFDRVRLLFSSEG